MSLQIVWFREALRTTDHPALLAAARAGAVLPVFVADPEDGIGGAQAWWRDRQLATLADDLARLGSPLIRRRGPATEVLPRLVRETGAKALHVTRALDPLGTQRQRDLARILASLAVTFESHDGLTLLPPEALRTGAGQPYRVFTPFWKALCAASSPPRPVPAPERLQRPLVEVTDEPEAGAMRRPLPSWTRGLAACWEPGEATGHERLRRFLAERIERYHLDRDLPGEPGTSSLSPWLANGALSVRQAWWAAVDSSPSPQGEGPSTWLRELGWREFGWHLLHHFPHTPESPLDSRFGDFPWREDPAGLEAWRRGRTGYPIVDAGMRQLWETGWMHNRVRMIVASFLVKDLLLPWQEGARWFLDTLVDADPASNTLGWQWAAGCGADAAPFFRIFNPVTQSRKFDPDGTYLARWVPELADLPPAWRHEPWLAPPLTRAGNYPLPVVDHAMARQRALAVLASRKGSR
ncbi:MAG: deoxyribodipyrimidine photo-lyase [Candidatus Sericytochromatia bacterium]|nr:deoxyribodipyrimidine photo-lyase [Candidatus Sericytochromatia bacterium]